MVTLAPKILPELRGCESFGFRAHTETNEQWNFLHRDLEDKREQERLVALVRLELGQMNILACEAEMEIGVRSSRLFMTGEIRPYEGRAQRRAHKILAAVNELLLDFTEQHTNSSFTIGIRQTVMITRVNRHSRLV